MNCKLIRVTSTNQNLRTPTVTGECPELPKVGDEFRMLASPLSGGDVRVIITSPVKVCQNGDKVCTFKTANSTYILELL